MGDRSGIEWTDATWNPITGCSHVSDGCRFCYAETLTRRFAGEWGVSDLPWTAGNAPEVVRLRRERLDVPLRWRRPRTVFVNSMSDLFHELSPVDFIAEVFAVMWTAERHTFQVLTKRPERAREVLTSSDFREAFDGGRGPWPLPNVWLGTSIESARHVDRADALRATPAAHRFISAEPLLGPLVGLDAIADVAGERAAAEEALDRATGLPPIDPLNLEGIEWLIAGGESGGHFEQRPERFLVTSATGGEPKPEAVQWVRDLRDACDAAGTAFMLKQWGGLRPKSSGRELDGRTYDWTPPPAGVASAA